MIKPLIAEIDKKEKNIWNIFLDSMWKIDK